MSKSAKQLRKTFLKRHREWEAFNNPRGILSDKMRIYWGKRIDALMNLVRRQQEVCTAPQGKLRIVHIDPRDPTPSRYGDYDSISKVRAALGKMLHAKALEMKVYNDQRKEVKVE